MSAPSPLATPIAWELVSADYAKEIAPQFEKYAGDAMRLAAVQKGSRVVDVACGPGTLAVLAARAGASVDALDFSEKMIAILKTRASSERLAIDARVGDGQSLPYPDASYDAAFSMFGLMFFPDRARGFAELRRVLRDGGRAVVASWTSLDRVPLLAEVFAALREAMPGLPAQGIAPLSTTDDARAEMTAGGFRDVAVHEVTHAMEAPSIGEFWASTTRTLAPLVLLKSKLGDAAWAPIAAGIEKRLRVVAGEGSVHVEMTALLAVGTK